MRNRWDRNPNPFPRHTFDLSLLHVRSPSLHQAVVPFVLRPRPRSRRLRPHPLVGADRQLGPPPTPEALSLFGSRMPRRTTRRSGLFRFSADTSWNGYRSFSQLFDHAPTLPDAHQEGHHVTPQTFLFDVKFLVFLNRMSLLSKFNHRGTVIPQLPLKFASFSIAGAACHRKIKKLCWACTAIEGNHLQHKMRGLGDTQNTPNLNGQGFQMRRQIRTQRNMATQSCPRHATPSSFVRASSSIRQNHTIHSHCASCVFSNFEIAIIATIPFDEPKPSLQCPLLPGFPQHFFCNLPPASTILRARKTAIVHHFIMFALHFLSSCARFPLSLTTSFVSLYLSIDR